MFLLATYQLMIVYIYYEREQTQNQLTDWSPRGDGQPLSAQSRDLRKLIFRRGGRGTYCDQGNFFCRS